MFRSFCTPRCNNPPLLTLVLKKRAFPTNSAGCRRLKVQQILMQPHAISSTAETAVQPLGDALKEPSLFHCVTKRCFDVVCSLCCMLLFAPFFLMALIVSWCTTSGNPFFLQERIGKGGKPFNIVKFRTMVVDAERDGARLVHEHGTHQFTRYGLFFRKYHIDEWPQLWNVLIGDMSLVGYRPERAYYIQQIEAADARYSQLYVTRPGITSEAAIYNGYTDSLEKMLRRLEMDLAYLPKLSVPTDLRIIGQTILSFFYHPTSKSSR